MKKQLFSTTALLLSFTLSPALWADTMPQTTAQPADSQGIQRAVRQESVLRPDFCCERVGF